ncbi:hypothetical protein [Staphylococcus caeli]|uniref:hypothetical protein n=1 Tax=Staphylococcus caeli TaxID=2201815 RepID=UPI003F57B62C
MECCTIENKQLPQSYYDDRDAIHKRIREVDEKHTNNYNSLSLILAEFKPVFTQIIETSKEMNQSQKELAKEQKTTNEHLSNQGIRISNIENDVANLEEDTTSFKAYMKKEEEDAKLKGKENKDFILKALGIFVGGGGIAWLIHPLFDFLKIIFK